jgi:5,10-methylenetetrahydromethanopterin reductase
MTPAVGILIPNELPYHDLVELAASVGELGYESAWYPDSRFLRDPFIGLAVLAQHAAVPLIGIATTDPYARHPALIATALATVSEMTASRVAIALGAGSSGLAALGVTRQRPVERVGHALRDLRALLRGDAVTYANDAPAVRVEFRAPQPALWIGTRSPRMLRLAGETADGLILGHLRQPDLIERALDEAERGTIERAPELATLDVRIRVQVVVGADEHAVNVAATSVAGWVLRQHAGRIDWLEALGLTVPHELPLASQAVVSPRDNGSTDLSIPDDVVDAFVLRASSTREAADEIARLAARWPVIVRLQSADGTPQSELARSFAANLRLAGR